MIRLRPHHLMCTQAYSGKGYSANFVTHMDNVVAQLRENQTIEIQLVASTDDLCAHCPNMLGPDQCQENKWVKDRDQKVLDLFHLTEGPCLYHTVTEQIRREMTPERLQALCGDCSWYSVSACRKVLLSLE